MQPSAHRTPLISILGKLTDSLLDSACEWCLANLVGDPSGDAVSHPRQGRITAAAMSDVFGRLCVWGPGLSLGLMGPGSRWSLVLALLCASMRPHCALGLAPLAWMDQLQSHSKDCCKDCQLSQACRCSHVLCAVAQFCTHVIYQQQLQQVAFQSGQWQKQRRSQQQQ